MPTDSPTVPTHRANDSARVRIFDTTLRDGEQAPGCSLTVREKRSVARQLARLGVDVLEAGFPAASPGDFDAVQAIARDAREWQALPVVCGLARATVRDIDAAARALTPAPRARIHTFLATSDVHLRHKLQLTRAQVRTRVRDMVAHAASLVADVQFSPEDATRSDIVFLHDVLHEAIDAGATTINIPDTVGYTTPDEYAALIAGIRDEVVRGRDIVIATHCHDDLGLAVANALAAVGAGARQVECTINGIGERAGNAALEEIVMALRTRHDRYGHTTRIVTTEIGRTSRLVARLTGMRVPANKAVVGANAFAHEAGIHQDGMLKHRDTYEIMRADDVGIASGGLVLGKHSGRAALRAHLATLGHTLDDATADAVFARFKVVADRKKVVDERELAAIVAGVAHSSRADRHVRTGSAGARQGVPRTLFDKLWRAHEVRAGSGTMPSTLYIDLHLIHEVTSPQAFAELAARGLRVRRPDRTLATMDHSTPTTVRSRAAVTDGAAAQQLDTLAGNCAAHGITLHALGDERRGIVHVIGPELGYTQPGMTIVCGDSHTSTHGAFGALAFGIGTSEVAHVLATQCLLQQRPRSMEVRVDGALPAGVTAKDVILAIIARIGVDGGTGHVIEYRGSVIRALDMSGRMTVCNMSIEAGARAGMIAPDDTTFAWLAGRPAAPQGAAWEAGRDAWQTLRTDDDAQFDRQVIIDASTLAPMITWGTNPGMGIAIDAPVPDDGTAASRRALEYMGIEAGRPLLGTPVDVVFVGSCTNGRLEDLRAAARLLDGRRVAPTTRLLVVPGSQQVKREAEAEGLADIFLRAGAEWRESGCSMCIAMNGDVVARGQRAISTSNRNFEGRQGAGARTLLASPETAAASAIAGMVADARRIAHDSNRIAPEIVA